MPQPPSAGEGNVADPVVDLISDDEDGPESATESEQAETNTEERRGSNSSSSTTPAPKPEDSEKGTNRYNSLFGDT